MARCMPPGSVIVDLAAERGGNCELTKPGETVVDSSGVHILGPVTLPATIPYHASQMYARNVSTFLKNMITKEGAINIDLSDEITRETLVARDGKVENPRVEALLGVKA
jgi:NAD(P) transhydrogenase subunit alpha